MTDPWQLDDNDNDGQQGKDPVRAQLKRLEKELKDERELRVKAEALARTSTIKDLLTEKKLSPKLAKLIPANVETTPEALETWLTEYGDLFVKPVTPPANNNDGDGSENSSGQPDDVTNDDEAVVNAFNRIAKANSGVTPPNSKPGELLNQILSKDLKEEDLLALITSHGGGVGSG